MMNFKGLSTGEKELMYKYPAYISLLAANTDGKFDEVEKLSAIDFNHVKTYSCDPELSDFFHKVDQDFNSIITELNKELPLGRVNRNDSIKKKLAELEVIILKIDDEHKLLIYKSIQDFKDHVSRAHHNVLVDFIFPVPIKGLNY